MQRREFITLLGGAAATWPLAARAQQPERMRRIAVLFNVNADDPGQQTNLAAFEQALQQLGWTEGRNVRIEVRWAGGEAREIHRHANELVALAPDVIVATGNSGMSPLLQATHTVPIVFNNVADPVGSGFVDSLARPGGNATGFIQFEYTFEREMAGTAQADCAGRDASGGPSGSPPPGRGRPIRHHPVRGPVGRGGRDAISVLDAGETSAQSICELPNGGLILTAVRAWFTAT